jgi:hypothetical protein
MTERAQEGLREARLTESGVSPPTMADVFGVRPNPHERLIALVVPAYGRLRLVGPSLEGDAARLRLVTDEAEPRLQSAPQWFTRFHNGLDAAT